MSMPVVSVIMSVRNAECTVADAIESVLSQTYTSFEFLIMNDGSHDKTGEILLQYQAKDARIHVYTQSVSVGLTVSLNTLLQHVRGEYIARIDGDG